MNKRELLLNITEGFVLAWRDPLWNDIMMDKSLKAITETPAFQKLDRIKQNGPTCRVYPGAMHTRLNHSLGVYHIGRQILIQTLENSTVPYTVKGMRSFLSACLLHDIGHFPYAHSLKELSIREHEELAGEIIMKDDVLRNAVINAGADPEWVAAIIDESKPSVDEVSVYRHILSGALDPDKLDYLNRDAFFCGVPYGSQNNGYIISRLHLIDGELALERDAYTTLEHILFSKYLMYANVYWHRDVRSATCMIKKALLSAIRDGVLSVEDLYFIDDGEFDTLALKYSDYEPLTLITMVRNNALLSRVWEAPWETDGILRPVSSDIYSRFRAEDRIYEALKKTYPSIRRHEVIIDIPEPISFEADMKILNEDGSLEPFSSVTKLFTKDVEKQFSASLRMIGLYAPSYVSRKCAKEIIENGKF
ncbi:MAG: HD domain-containing protein [Bullifex sp.]